MNTDNQLPTLPTPKFTETIRGVPCITVTEHEHLMRTYALQAIANATQSAEVTDERQAFEAEMRCEDVWGHRSLKKRTDGRYENWQVDLMWDVWQARSKLAMRTVQVPMTQEQIMEAEQSSYVDSRKPVYTTDCWGDEKTEYEPTKYFNMFKFARAIEAHHGITAQAKKEDA